MSHIRQATTDDAEVIDYIWRQRLDEDQPPNEESLNHFRKMLEEQDDVFQCWVLEEDGEIKGWGSVNPMRNSPALRNTMAECSCYIARCERGKGFGKRFLEHIIEYAEQTPIEQLIWFSGKSNQKAQDNLRHCGLYPIAEIPPVEKAPDRDVIVIMARPVGKITPRDYAINSMGEHQ